MPEYPESERPEISAPTADSGLTRRNLLLGAGLLAVSATAFARAPQSHIKPLPEGTLEKLIPTNVGAWKFKTASGLVLPPPDPLSDKLYSEVMTRLYTAPNMPPLGLLIAYSNVQNGLLQLHRPETCYPASGYALSNTEVSKLQVASDRQIPVRKFSAEGVSNSEQVLYWTRVGTDLPTSWASQRMAVAKANLRTEIPDGILVRISLVSNQMSAETDRIVEDFVSTLLNEVTPVTRKLLVGLA